MSEPARTGTDLRVGELAERTGRSTHAIRWYCDQGLIPGVGRDAAGRRVFGPRHVAWLGLIDRLRSTGMSVKDIRIYAQLVAQGPASLTDQRKLLAAHREHVMHTLLDWQAALALIDGKLAFYDHWIETGERPDHDRVRQLARPEAIAGRKGPRQRQRR